MSTHLQILMLVLGVSLSSCFEVLEEVNMNKDGSGELLFTVNASQSKLKLNSILSLDSFRGMEIPNQNRINTELDAKVLQLNQYAGIEAEVTIRDFENYIFAIKVGFDHIDRLNVAAREMKKDHTGSKVKDSIAYSPQQFLRTSVWNFKQQKSRINAEDLNILKEAHYTCIYRFDRMVKSSNRSDVRISGSKKAVMLKLPISELINQNNTLNQTITFQ